MRKEIGREWQVPDNLEFNAVFLDPILLWETDVRSMFDQRLLIRYPSGLLRMLMKVRPDVVVGLEFRIDCIVGWLWALLHGRGYVTWSDMTPYHDVRMGFFRTINRKLILSRSHALIGSCTDTVNHFSDNFGYSKSKTFLSLLSAHIDENEAGGGVGEGPGQRNDGQFRLLYVGELIPRKGVDLLIRAFAQLLDCVPRAVLTLVGKGTERESLENLAESLGCGSSIIFLGSIPYESVPGEMVKHDVFVLPTRLDVFGLVVPEAMACGLPVICSRYAGAANDLVKDNGMIVDPENLDEMASAMRELACNPQMRIRMAEAGKLMLRKHDLNSAVKGYGDALRLALRTAKRTNG
jgi:glycosyltransferase involved in cell wall biosynthesis